jgi:iron(III) transport system substrate-binding protein
MAGMLAAGQVAINAMNYSYLALDAAKDGAPVTFRRADGTVPMPGFARPNGVSVVKGAQHPHAAWLFNQWILSEDGQKVLFDYGQGPVMKIEGDTSHDGVTILPYDIEALATDAKAWASRYDQLLRGLPAGPQS